MKVVILCGGMGTRLREETEYKPKPMVEIGGKPILWHIMKGYAARGFKEFVLCLGYRQQVIREYFLHYQSMNKDFTVHLSKHEEITYHSNHDEDWTVTLADTGDKTPKGTRIKMVEKYIDGDEFMITYGDGVCDVDAAKLLEFHRSHGKIATFTGVHPISRFATVETDAKGGIVDWNEKKSLEGYINAGFFVASKNLFKYLDDDCELEEMPMKALAREGQLRMYQHNGFWQCMDTYRDATLLNELWASGKAPWKVW
jgi:glucose-1-phosphate cytidylyltransferase